MAPAGPETGQEKEGCRSKSTGSLKIKTPKGFISCQVENGYIVMATEYYFAEGRHAYGLREYVNFSGEPQIMEWGWGGGGTQEFDGGAQP